MIWTWRCLRSFVQTSRDPFHVPLPYRIAEKTTCLKVAFWRETPGFEAPKKCTVLLMQQRRRCEMRDIRSKKKSRPFGRNRAYRLCRPYGRSSRADGPRRKSHRIRRYSKEFSKNTSANLYHPGADVKIHGSTQPLRTSMVAVSNEYPLYLALFTPTLFSARSGQRGH